jgi:threonine/homoserine/homoserine lactone efflux protein
MRAECATSSARKGVAAPIRGRRRSALGSAKTTHPAPSTVDDYVAVVPSIPHTGAFVAASVVLLVIPGPAVLFILTRSGAQGARAGFVSILGIHAASVVHVLATVAGLSAIIVASASAVTVVKVLGGASLVFLGLRTILSTRTVVIDRRVDRASSRRLFAEGFMINLLNPKVALFFLAFLPQFVDAAGAPVWSQTLLLGLLYVAIGSITDGAYAMIGGRVGAWMSHRPIGAGCAPRLAEGGVLIGLGALTLALPHRSRP